MPIISQIICDGCQAVKKETNHWYTLVLNQEHQTAGWIASRRCRCSHSTPKLTTWRDAYQAKPLPSACRKAAAHWRCTGRAHVETVGRLLAIPFQVRRN